MAYTHEQIEQAIAEWRQRLGLERWKVRVLWKDALDDDTVAQVTPNRQRCSALLELTEGICSTPAEDINELAAHEMIHLHTYGMYRTAQLLLSNAGTELQTTANDIMHREWELVTDALAAAITIALPLPESLRDGAEDEPFRVTE
ncbi:MAG: hypothetical protein VB144_11545 [Clostridia bacterium]|nr:hypothetical protein [Clostridia bacterium]